MPTEAVPEAAAEVHDSCAVGASAGRLLRQHQRSDQRSVSHRLLMVLLVYHGTGQIDWCMMAATALGIANLICGRHWDGGVAPPASAPFLGG